MAGGKGKIKPEDGKPFQKGDPRINRKGRPRKLPNLDKLLAETLGEHIDGSEAMRLVLLGLRERAIKGDVRASELLLDRAYGKLRQSASFEVDIMKLSDTQLEEIIHRLIKK